MLLQSAINFENLDNFKTKNKQTNSTHVHLNLRNKIYKDSLSDLDNLKDLIRELFKNSIVKKSLSFLALGIIFLLIIIILYCCYFKQGKSKSYKTSSKVKIKSTLVLKQPVSTSAIRTATISQNDETMSLTNMVIDNELNLIAPTAKQDKQDKKSLKLSQNLDSLKKDQSTNLTQTKQESGPNYPSDMKSVFSIHSSFKQTNSNLINKSKFTSSLSQGSEISAAATQRIKRLKKKNTGKKAKVRSKRKLPEPKCELYHTKKSHKIAVNHANNSKSNDYSTDRSIDKTKNSTKDKSKDSSKDKTKDRSTNPSFSESKTKESKDVKTFNRIRKQIDRKQKKRLDKKRKNLNFKILANRLEKSKRAAAAKTAAEAATAASNLKDATSSLLNNLNTIKIYDKTIEIKNKSNELISIFKQIPTNFTNSNSKIATAKLPLPKELFSPPSQNTLLKKGKQIPDMTSSESTSEELINNLKRFKAKSKEKIKTTSTGTMLDGVNMN